jgi:nicotinic acid phosphoribosyltransferase
MHPSRRDSRSLALLTDLYQLTMAFGYWKGGKVSAHREQQLALFHPGIKRLVNPHAYPVGLEQQLFDLETRLILEARGVAA